MIKEKKLLAIILMGLIFIITISIHYLFSSVLTITVPKDYVGKICLVLSNINNNFLEIDSNGIGYINKKTFYNIHNKPIVINTDGENLSLQCVGFSPSAFWSIGKSSITATNDNNKKINIRFISFEIVPKDKLGQKQYYNIDLSKVDWGKVYK